MKRIILIFCLLGGFAQATVAQTGIIGINTENPRGVLHIDGASDNPASGNPNATQAGNDVVVDASGRVGIGVLSPSAKLDVVDGYVRIQDGTEGAGKVLVSDANGVGMWTTMTGGWYAFLYNDPPPSLRTTVPLSGEIQFKSFSGQVISSSSEGAISSANGTIRVPFKGRYRLTISVDWLHTTVGPPYSCKASIRVNGSEKWAPSSWGGPANYGVLPTFVAIMELNANEELTAYTVRSNADSADMARAVVFGAELLQNQ